MNTSKSLFNPDQETIKKAMLEFLARASYWNMHKIAILQKAVPLKMEFIAGKGFVNTYTKEVQDSLDRLDEIIESERLAILEQYQIPDLVIDN